MSERQTEPMTPMAEATAHLHEMFVTLVAGGFTEAQALHMLGVMLATNGQQQQGGSS